MLVEPSELTEVIWVTPGISENCRSSGVRDVRGHGLRAGARQAGADLDGREVHLRQRRHRQVEEADDAEHQERRRDQRGGDRPADEGRGDVHARRLRLAAPAAPAALAAGAPHAGRATPARLQRHLAVGDHRLAGAEAALDHRDGALGGDHVDRLRRPTLLSGPTTIDEGAVRALVHRRAGTVMALRSVCRVSLHVDELARPQLPAGVGEARLQLHRAGGLVDVVVGDDQLARRRGRRRSPG